jgi:hypothetical protein
MRAESVAHHLKRRNVLMQTAAWSLVTQHEHSDVYISFLSAEMLRAASPQTALTTAGGSQPIGLICAM